MSPRHHRQNQQQQLQTKGDRETLLLLHIVMITASIHGLVHRFFLNNTASPLVCPSASTCLAAQTVCPGVGEHPLQYNYTFWYSRRTPSRPASSQSYEQNIRQIGTVASVRTHSLIHKQQAGGIRLTAPHGRYFGLIWFEKLSEGQCSSTSSRLLRSQPGLDMLT